MEVKIIHDGQLLLFGIRSNSHNVYHFAKSMCAKNNCIYCVNYYSASMIPLPACSELLLFVTGRIGAPFDLLLKPYPLNVEVILSE